MLLKIEREVCLAKYRKFPLSPYDTNVDEYVFYYPKTIQSGWYALQVKTKKEFPKILKTEFTKLIRSCGFDHLIFLRDNTTSWITKLSAKRSDQEVLKAVQYFDKNNLGKKFDGGVQVPISELPEFIKHFYCVTACDASFYSFHFLDPSQSLLGFIHYSGEVQFCTLNKKFDALFSEVIGKTAFKETIGRSKTFISLSWPSRRPKPAN